MRFLSFVAPLQDLSTYLRLAPVPCHPLCLRGSIYALSGPPSDSWTRFYLLYLLNDLPPIFPLLPASISLSRIIIRCIRTYFRYLPYLKQTLLRPTSRLSNYITILQQRDQNRLHSQSDTLFLFNSFQSSFSHLFSSRSPAASVLSNPMGLSLLSATFGVLSSLGF